MFVAEPPQDQTREFTPKTLKDFQTALQKGALETIDFSPYRKAGNSLTATDIRPILDQLATQDNFTIKRLNLQNCQLTKNDSLALQRILIHCPLAEIDIRHTQLPLETIQDFYDKHCRGFVFI